MVNHFSSDQDSMATLVDKLVDNLFARTLNVSPLHNAGSDLDTTTFGKVNSMSQNGKSMILQNLGKSSSRAFASFTGPMHKMRRNPYLHFRSPVTDPGHQLRPAASAILWENPSKPGYNGFSERAGPFVVGVAGGTASGKTCVADVVQKNLEMVPGWGKGSVASFSIDCFYKDLTSEQLKDVAAYNFDHPDAFDFDGLHKVMSQLRMAGTVQIPKYDYVNNRRCSESEAEVINGEHARVIIVEGILVLHSQRVRELLDLSVFVDVDSDTRLCRRLRRDVQERGRDVQGVLAQYERTVKPSFDAFCRPSKQFADIVVPRGVENGKAIQVLIDAVQKQCAQHPISLHPELHEVLPGWHSDDFNLK